MLIALNEVQKQQVGEAFLLAMDELDTARGLFPRYQDKLTREICETLDNLRADLFILKQKLDQAKNVH